jgi:hypothetical protein
LGNSFGAAWFCANAIDAAKAQMSTALKISLLVFTIRFPFQLKRRRGEGIGSLRGIARSQPPLE